MNKFYYIENNEVKEIETVKDLEFIKKNKHKSAVKLKKDLSLPEGYEIKSDKIKMTKEKEAEIKEQEKDQEDEKLIQAKIREIAIEALKSEGKLQNYKNVEERQNKLSY